MKDVSTGAAWRTSSRCASGNCLAASFSNTDVVLVRDTKEPRAGHVLRFTAAQWQAFVAGIRDEEFSRLS